MTAVFGDFQFDFPFRCRLTSLFFFKIDDSTANRFFKKRIQQGFLFFGL